MQAFVAVVRPTGLCFCLESGSKIADCSAVNLGTIASGQRQRLCALRVFAVQKHGRVSGVGSPGWQSDATPVDAMICVYLRDLRFLRFVGEWSSCRRVFVFATWVGGRFGEAATILSPYRVME